MLLTVSMGRRAWVNRLLLMFASLCCAVAANAGDAPVDHQLGTQYSPLRQINTGNVAKLTKAWEFHTGDDPNEVKGLVAMEDQPSLIEGNLVVCSTNRRLFALNAVTGQKRWEFDPGHNVGRLRKCRGITSWIDRDAAAESECKTRIVLGTTDYRLVALATAMSGARWRSTRTWTSSICPPRVPRMTFTAAIVPGTTDIPPR
jgi:quinoprotein glucose dehydrogenase